MWYDSMHRHEHSDNVDDNYVDPIRTTADEIDYLQVDFGINSELNVTCDFNKTVHSSTARSAPDVSCIGNNTNSTIINNIEKDTSYSKKVAIESNLKQENVKQENGRINQQLQTDHNVNHSSTCMKGDSIMHSKTIQTTCDTESSCIQSDICEDTGY